MFYMSIILLHVCDTLFILQRISVSNTLYILFRECSVVVLVRYCALLDWIFYTHRFYSFVCYSSVASTFPLNGTKKYLTWLDLTWLKIYNRQNPNTKKTTTSDVATRPHGYVQQYTMDVLWPQDHVGVFNTPCKCTVCLHHRCTVATGPRRRVQYTVWMYCGR